MEWLANIHVKWVLVTVGILLAARSLLPRGKPGCARLREAIDAASVALVLVFLLLRPFVVQAYFIPSDSMHPSLRRGDRVLVNKLAYRFAPPRRGDVVVFTPPPAAEQGKEYIKRLVALPGEQVEVVPPRVLVDGKTLLRLTRRSAPDMAAENFGGYAGGPTYAVEGGGATMDGDRVLVSSGLNRDLTVALLRPGDRVEERGSFVYLNGSAVLALLYGPPAVSGDLHLWGGDRDLEGTVYSEGGNPRLILVRGETLSVDTGHVLVDGRRLEEPYVERGAEYAMGPLRVQEGSCFVLGDNRGDSFDSHAWGPLPLDRVLGRADLLFWPPGRLGLVRSRGAGP